MLPNTFAYQSSAVAFRRWVGRKRPIRHQAFFCWQQNQNLVTSSIKPSASPLSSLSWSKHHREQEPLPSMPLLFPSRPHAYQRQWISSSSSTTTSIKTTSLVQQWKQRHDELVNKIPLGSMGDNDWGDAVGLLDWIRSGAFQSSATNDADNNNDSAVLYAFALLDTLCDEIEFNNNNKKSSKQQQHRQLDIGVVAGVLVTWRDAMLQHLAGNDHPFDSEQLDAANLRHPSDVLQRVERYYNLELVQATPQLYNILLHVLGRLAGSPLSRLPMRRGKDKSKENDETSKSKQDDDNGSNNRSLSSDPEFWVQLGQGIFDKMLQEKNGGFHPNAITVTAMIELWAQSGLTSQAPAQAEHYLSLLKHWEKDYNNNNEISLRQEEFRPRPNTFCAVMEAHSRSNEYNKKINTNSSALQRIQELLDEMKSTCRLEGQEGSMALTRACHAAGSCSHPRAPDVARAILDDMSQQYQQQSVSQSSLATIKPSDSTVHAVLNAYANAGRVNDAQTLLNDMERLADDLNDNSLRPSLRCYNTMIWMHAKLGDVQQAEAILMEMLHSPNKKTRDLDLWSWNGVLTAWAESGDPNAEAHIQRLIQLLEQKAQDGVDIESQKRYSSILTASIYNKLLGCYAQSPKVRSRDASQALAHKAQDRLEWMKRHNNPNIHPNGESYLNGMLAWSNAGNASRCEALLHELCDLVRNGRLTRQENLEQRQFSVVVSAWSNSSDSHAAQRAQAIFDMMVGEFGIIPDVVSYTALIWAWARSRSIDPIEPVERIFEEMKQRSSHSSGSSVSCRPNSFTYNAVLYGLSRSSHPQSIHHADIIFRKAQEQDKNREKKEPPLLDHIAYNTHMSAWSNRNMPDRTESLFHELVAGYNAGNKALRPGFSVFVTRLQAWSKAGNPELASLVLQEMFRGHESGLLERKPETREFTAVLQAWLRSNRSTLAAEKAEAGLRQMMQFAAENQFDCAPNLFSFMAVITSYARSDSLNAGTKAVSLFKEMQQPPHNLAPNFLTCAEVITALCRASSTILQSDLPPEQQNELLREHESMVVQVLREVQTKTGRFWSETRTDIVLGKIDKALENSGFVACSAQAGQLLHQEFQRLQVAAMNGSPPRSPSRDR